MKKSMVETLIRESISLDYLEKVITDLQTVSNVADHEFKLEAHRILLDAMELKHKIEKRDQ